MNAPVDLVEAVERAWWDDVRDKMGQPRQAFPKSRTDITGLIAFTIAEINRSSEPSDDDQITAARAGEAWSTCTGSENDGSFAAARVIEAYGDRRAQSAIAAYQAHMASDGVVQGDSICPTCKSNDPDKHPLTGDDEDEIAICKDAFHKVAAHRRAAAGNDKLTMTIKLTDAEQSALEKLMEEQELSKQAVFRQALRSYQLDHERRKDGETVTWSGDTQRARDFAGSLSVIPQPDPRDAEIERLREALAPFARECDDQERVTSFRDGDCVIPRSKIKIKELRRARTALANSEGRANG